MANTSPPFSFIVSSDSYLLRKELEIVSGGGISERSSGSLNSGDLFQPEVHTFWGDEGLSDKFWEHLTLQGLFATPKILIIRNAQILVAAVWKQLSEALGKGFSAVTTVLCLEVTFEKGKPKIPAHIVKLPCFLHAQKKGWTVMLPGLTQASMPKFIQEEAKRQGILINSTLASRLCHALQPDAARIATELEKLALTADAQGRIPEESLALIEQNSEATIFDILRSLQSGVNIAAVWRQLHEDSLSGENLVFSFLAVLTREARALWQILAGEQPALPPQVFQAKKILSHTLGYSGVAKLWEFALEADRSIKSGEKSPEQVFELLTADLSQLFRKSPSSHR